jgi:hypothetical protein
MTRSFVSARAPEGALRLSLAREHRRALLALGACAALSCGETGRDYVDVALYVQGAEAREIAVPSATLLLSEAEVLLGPLYLCATESAESALCETALGEQLSVLTIDALEQAEQRRSVLTATTGTVRSAFFDYGMSWLLTKPAPAFPEELARPHSARLRFSAIFADGAELDVRAELDIAPLAPGDAAVNGRKTEQTIGKEPLALTLRIDPNDWLSRIRAEDLRALDADGDGQVLLTSDSQPYEAILQGMTARYPPQFVWSEAP